MESLTGAPCSLSRTERHPVVSVCSHGEKGHSEPAGAGGAGDVEPGVVFGERVGRGGGRRGGGRLHGHLSLTPKLKTMQRCRRLSCHSMSVTCHVRISTRPLSELTLDPTSPASMLPLLSCPRWTSEQTLIVYVGMRTSSAKHAAATTAARDVFQRDSRTIG